MTNRGSHRWINRHLAKVDVTNVRDDKGKVPDTMVAVDLSVKDDFSAVSYNMYLINRFHIHTVYYIPEETLKGAPQQRLYQRWENRVI